MNELDYSSLAARVLRLKPSEVRQHGLTREQGIDIIGRAMTAQAARRRERARIAGFAGALSAAAAFVLVMSWARQTWFSPISHQDLTVADCRAGDDCSLPDLGQISGRAFAPGHTVASGRGRSTMIAFEPGTELVLDEQSELEYRQGSALRRFGLLRGTVRLHVAKLAKDHRFIVETGDAEVEVRGTSFAVERLEQGQECADALTRVTVEEGVVEVRFRGASNYVRAHEIWPASCATHEQHPAASSSRSASLPVAEPSSVVTEVPRGASALRTGREVVPSEAAVEIIDIDDPASGQPDEVALPKRARAKHVAASKKVAVARADGSKRRQSTRGAPRQTRSPAMADATLASEQDEPSVDPTTAIAQARPKPQPKLEDMIAFSSRLALQNQLFAEAVAARRAGRPAEALEIFERLITHFPGGPLTESSMVERMRIFVRTDRGRAADAAQHYLDNFPRGFAQKEAEAVVAAAP